MATKGAQSIQNTCTASNNVVDVSSHCEVVYCKSDAQDRDVLDSFKAFYNGLKFKFSTIHSRFTPMVCSKSPHASKVFVT